MAETNIKNTQFTNRTDSMTAYFKEINRYNTMSKEQERELFARYKGGDETALNEIITSTLRYVVSIAKEYQYQGISLEDLISEGNLGLIEAVKRYDVDGGTCFLTYANWWVRKAIIEALNLYSRPFSITDDFSKIYRKFLPMRNTFVAENGYEPEVEDVMAGIGVGVKVGTAIKELSSFSTIGEGDALAQYIPDESADASTFDIVTMSDTINQALSTLTKRDEQVIRMFFGIGIAEHTLEEIAEELCLSEERTRQIKEHALERLRTNARKKLFEF